MMALVQLETLAEDFEQLRQSHVDFVEASEAWAQDKQVGLAASKAKHAAEIASSIAQQKRALAEAAAQRTQTDALLSLDAAADERQRGVATANGLLATSLAKTHNDREDAAFAVATLEANLATRKAALAAAEATRAEQAKRNAPELAFYQDKLGLAIKSTKKNILHFVYTNIDKKDYAREFSFVLDVSKGSEYRLVECTPAIPSISEAMTFLNSSRDFFRFLKEMRREFSEYDLRQNPETSQLKLTS
ncbi:kinetochore-associated Ndc80 complex subunit spc25 [Physocladia obscura]|uniref:Kinetochore protein SPC25 n=1 Tax=Physocladia obscura TaxID=109957 RepID=A0AAD5T796_9FUNG|nr:kinetochore-associated Ndc80 complex subunit spc25 [Physocladia obscura]